MSVTRSTTETYARMAVIKFQFRVALRQTTNISEADLDQLISGVDNQWIQKLTIYGFTKEKLCRAQLTLSIDWNEHRLQLEQGRTVLALEGKNWVGQTAGELNEALMLFNDFVKQYQLRTEWAINYTQAVHNDTAQLATVRKAMGTSPMEPVKWAGPQQGGEVSIRDLPEVKVSCYVI